MDIQRLWRSFLSAEWSSLAVLCVLAILALAVIAPAFLTPFNQYVLMRTLAVLVIVATAQLIVIGIGQMNLAVGGIGGMVAVFFAGMIEVWGLPLPVAMMGGLLAGVLAGVLNGAIIAYTGINGFIVTLATMSIFTGLNYGVTESIPFYDMPKVLTEFGDSRIGPFAGIMIVPVITTLILGWFLKYSLYGRQLLAVGGNAHASELVGISVKRITMLAHAISGALAGIAGMLAVARLGIGQPSIGSDWLLASFAGPVIGGAILTGGHVPIIGTLFGVLLIVLIENGLILANVDPFYVQFCLGFLILAAVGFNHWRGLRAEAALRNREA